MIQDRERVRDPEKLELTVRGKALDILNEIAEQEDKTVDEVLRESLGLKQWALEVKENGDTVIVRHGKKDKYELAI